MSGEDEREAGDLMGADDAATGYSDEMDAVRRYWDELPDPQQRILLADQLAS